MTRKEVARYIDISAVRTQHSLKDLEVLADYARRYHFINVHVLPCWVKTLREMLRDTPDVYAGSPVGFPDGAHKTETKLMEAQQLILDGVQEMDVVINVGRLKNHEDEYVLNELKQIKRLTPEDVLLKAIIEINCLTDEEMERACSIVMESGADFIKTGTGWVNGDANIARIAKIKKWTQGKIKVKAAGGIRTRQEFDQLLDLGIERFGINLKSAIEIVESFGC